MARKSSIVILSALLVIVFLAKPAAAGGQTPLQPQDLFGLSVAETPQIRPGDSLVAYVRKSNDVMTDIAHESLWLVDTKTRAQSQVSNGAGDSRAGSANLHSRLSGVSA